MNNKIYGMIGLAKRSGKLYIGYDAVKDNISSKKMHLILVAEDASSKMKQQISELSLNHHIPIKFYGSKIDLGHVLGRQEVSYIGITDVNMADFMIKQL